MRFITKSAIALIIIASFTGCDSTSPPNPQTVDKDIIGSWKARTGEVISFNQEGKMLTWGTTIAPRSSTGKPGLYYVEANRYRKVNYEIDSTASEVLLKTSLDATKIPDPSNFKDTYGTIALQGSISFMTLYGEPLVSKPRQFRIVSLEGDNLTLTRTLNDGTEVSTSYLRLSSNPNYFYSRWPDGDNL